MQKLTDRQRAVLEFISASIIDRGYPPTLREIGNHLGIRSTNGVNDHLRALERKGYLTREDMKSRTLRLVRTLEGAPYAASAVETLDPPASAEPDGVLADLDLVEIPILGRVAAGALSEAFENPEDSVRVDRMMVGGTRDVFGLRIRGESMIEAGIHDGDYVFVKKQLEANRGQIVIAMVGEDATCKYYFPERDHIRLQPANAQMAPILVPKTDWRSTHSLGVVVGVYRRLHGRRARGAAPSRLYSGRMSVPPPIDPPLRHLLGPGPSDVPDAVLRALAKPTIGHLDPAFLRIMEELKTMLGQVYGAERGLAIPISGTGSAGMECAFVNLVEPGDRVLVGRCGVFGARMTEVARRAGAEVVMVEAPMGRAIDPDDLRRAAQSGPFRVLAVVHAETSTGVLQDLAPLRAIADEAGALLLVDAVTSLAGLPVDFDRLGIDVAYSGTQKCLSCPPGLAPMAFSERAVERVRSRTRPAQSWYLDLGLLLGYWGTDRVYHHTAPINMLYGLHEALRLALLEGLPTRYERHRRHARALWAGLEALGLPLLVAPGERLPPLTVVGIPGGVDEGALRAHLLDVSRIEIGAGLGELRGRALRIGLMGASSTTDAVRACLRGLGAALEAQGRTAPVGDAIAAADAALGGAA